MSFDNGIGTVWTVYSGTGQIQIVSGGYGMGGYGEGPYGDGTTTIIITELFTQWTPYYTK